MYKKKILLDIYDINKAYFENGKVIDKGLSIKHDHLSDNEGSIVTFLKELFKKNYKLYNIIVYLFSQSYFDLSKNKLRNNLIKKSSIVLNMGSGNKIIDNKIINLDIINYDNVDIVSDAKNISILDNKIDLIINELNLEHVYEYKSVVNESYRILKKGGNIRFLIPFIEGFHASPHDYTRFTKIGIEKIFKDAGFIDIKIGVYSGPASGFLWIFIEFLSILFSFNIKILYEINTIVFMLLLWPIKFLDIFLNHYNFSENISGVFYLIAKK